MLEDRLRKDLVVLEQAKEELDRKQIAVAAVTAYINGLLGSTPEVPALPEKKEPEEGSQEDEETDEEPAVQVRAYTPPKMKRRMGFVPLSHHILQVLREAGRPLEIRVIAAAVLKRGYVSPNGETDIGKTATKVSAVIIKEVSQGNVVKVDRGLYEISSTMQDLPEDFLGWNCTGCENVTTNPEKPKKCEKCQGTAFEMVTKE